MPKKGNNSSDALKRNKNHLARDRESTTIKYF